MSSSLRTAGTILASKYRVDSLLGEGGMGVVLAATHLQLHEQVAIKLLRAEAATRPDAVERFLREARVAMKLRGEHVVRVLDVGTLEDGAPFIAMECLKGSDLGRVLRLEGRLPFATAVDYVLQACEAIAEAHALGVIHRDLKPANLFVTERVDGSPCVKVLDFGVSKIVGALQEGPDLAGATSDDAEMPESLRTVPRRAPPEGRVGVTGTRALLGSPRYMAPEQLRSPRDVDVRADVWALGIILFELIAGEPPFAGETVEEIRAAMSAGAARTLEGVPSGLARAVRSCLAVDPAGRCPSVPELVQSLAPFASAEGAESVTRVRRMVSARPPPGSASSSYDSRASEDRAIRGGVVRDVRGPMRRASLALGLVALLGAGGAVAWRTLVVGRTPTSGTASAAASSTPAIAAATSALLPRSPSSATAAPPATPEPLAASATPPSPATTERSTRLAPRGAAQPGPASALAASAKRPAPTPAPPSPPMASKNAPPDPLKLDAGFLFGDRK